MRKRTPDTIPEDYPVGGKIYDLIAIGQQAAETVKRLNRYGSANQVGTEKSIKRTHTGIDYIDKQKWTKDKEYLKSIESKKTNKEKHITKSQIWSRPRRIFDVVSVLGSANCDGLGAMTYALCRDWLPNDCFSAWVATSFHTFCIIGYVEDTGKLGGKDNKDNWVVVDAWTLKPAALLHIHSDWQGQGLQWYSVGRGKGGTQGELIQSSMKEKSQATWEKYQKHKWHLYPSNLKKRRFMAGKTRLKINCTIIF